MVQGSNDLRTIISSYEELLKTSIAAESQQGPTACRDMPGHLLTRLCSAAKGRQAASHAAEEQVIGLLDKYERLAVSRAWAGA